MNAFGYTDDSNQGILLENVVLAMTPEAMWEFARFVVFAAAEMERLGEDFDQLHFRRIFSSAWQEQWSDVRLVRAGDGH